MKTQYFGKIKKANWDSEDFITLGKKEKHFYYEVESGHDDTHINDTCGRTIPIDKEHLSELINALINIEARL